MDDEAMFKFDEQLAAAFRSMKRPTKKEKKEKRKEVASFRLRALDLLEVVVKGDRCGDFVTVRIVCQTDYSYLILLMLGQLRRSCQDKTEFITKTSTILIHFL